MDPNHSKFIPSAYRKQIICSVDYCVYGEFIIVTCTKQGDLIEFLMNSDSEEHGVKDSNCIDIDVNNVKVIRIFFSLNDPVRIFYLLHTHCQLLLVIEKVNNQLKIKEKIHKVEKFEISDLNQTGSPQVSIWYRNSAEPNVTTDFSDELTELGPSDQPNDQLAKVLKTQLKMLDEKIVARQCLLEDKIRMRSETFQAFSQRSDRGNLKIVTTTQRIFSGKWFIIIHLENTSGLPIVDLNFIMSLKKNTVLYKSFVLENGTSQISHLKLLKHTCVCIISLDLPVFTSEKVMLGGTLYYCIQTRNKADVNTTITNPATSENTPNVGCNLQDDFINEYCLIVPSIELDVQCLLDDTYQCITANDSTRLEDIYCIMLASSRKRFTTSSTSALHEALTSMFHCTLLSVEPQTSCSYYYSQHSVVNETLFCLDSATSTLTVYYKSESKITIVILLLKQLINEMDETIVSSMDFQADLSRCLNLLRNEILHDTLAGETPRDFFNVNKKHIFEIQKMLSKYQS